MSGFLDIWPRGWTREQRSSATILAACVALVVILLSASRILAWLPEPIGPSARDFSDGTLVTVELTFLSGLAGIVVGILTAVLKLSPVPPLRWLAESYIWVFRGTPLLVQVFFVFFALPELIPIQLSDFNSAALALTLNVGAYNAEAIRAGILAVPRGQTEAARSLGLSPIQSFRDVVFPQAFKIALPPLVNNLVALLKDSSLAYVIGVAELSNIGNRVKTATFQPVPVFIVTAAIYLVLTTVLTQISDAIESRLDVEQRR